MAEQSDRLKTGIKLEVRAVQNGFTVHVRQILDHGHGDQPGNGTCVAVTPEDATQLVRSFLNGFLKCS